MVMRVCGNKGQIFRFDIFYCSSLFCQILRSDPYLLITAEGDYSRIWIHNDKDEMLLKSLKAWETILPDKYFYRVHRSTIVNIEYIEKIEKTTSNRFLIHLSHFDHPIVISQRRSTQLKKKIAL